MELINQVEYINKALENNSLNSVCEEIGISESTVRDRFKRKGYIRQGNEFINTEVTSTNKPTKEKLNKNIKHNIDTINTKKKNSNNPNDIKALEYKVNSLEKQIQSIMQIINTNNTINTINNSELKKYKGNTVSRNYRINEEVQKEFKLICNKFTSGTEYTVTDIVSLALEEFIN